MFSTQQYFGFDPRTIPSCQLWLDAADSNTFTFSSGSNISQWRDKSSTSNHVSALSGTTTRSGSSVVLSSSFMTFTRSALFSGTTGTSVFFVFSIPSNIGNGHPIGNDLASSGQASSFNWADNVLYENIGFSTRQTVGAVFPGNTDQIYTNIANRGGNTLILRNGTQVFSAAYGSAYAGSTAYRIGTRDVGTSYPFTGTLYEIVYYSTTLTLLQQQQVEGYLAWKWGLQTSLPTGHLFRTNPTTMRDFQPIDISGCAMWLDAADTTSTSMTLSGGNVSVWRDKSGNGNNTTTATGPPLLSNSAINGRSAIRLQTGSYFAIEPLATPANQTTVSAFVVATVTSNASSYGRLLSYGRTADGTANTDFQTVSNFTFLRESTTQSMAIYRNSPSVLPNRAMSITYGTPFLMECIFDGTNGNPFLNGGSNATFASTGTFTFNRLGIGYNINTKTDPADVYNGLVGEVIVYYTALTTTQRQQVEGYLIRKWGIELPFVISSPLSIPGCQLWLDAADTTSTSMTLSGGNVSVWRDKSGNGNNTTTATGPPLLSNSAINGRSAIRLQTGSYFAIEPLTNAANQTTVSAFVVATMTSNAIAYGRLFSTGRIADGTANNDFQTVSNFTFARDNLNQTIAIFRNVPSAVANRAMSITYGTPFLVECIFDGTNGNPFLNGTSNATFSSTGTFTFNRLGIGYNINTKTDPNEVYTGLVGEVIVYYTALSTTQRQQIEMYLGSKWGITTAVPLQPSYLLQRSIPSTPLFVPPLLSNCQLWLDAADPSGNGTRPSNGSTLTSWTDKSGNARNLGVGSGTTTWNTNSVRLNSSYMFVTSAVNLSSVSFFIVVASPTAVNNQTVFVGRPNTVADWNSTDGFGFYIDNNNGTRVYGTAGQVTSFANTGSTATFMTSAVFSSSGSFSSWTNGGTQANAATGTRGTTAQGFAIGGNWTGSSWANIISSAYIYEIVVYNTTLSTTDRQQVEGYLAWKWGLQASLPTTHPYYKFRP